MWKSLIEVKKIDYTNLAVSIFFYFLYNVIVQKSMENFEKSIGMICAKSSSFYWSFSSVCQLSLQVFDLRLHSNLEH